MILSRSITFTLITLASLAWATDTKAWDIPPEDWDGLGDGSGTSPGAPADSGQPAPPATPTPGEKKATAEVVTGGVVVLPTTGIRVDLPNLTQGATYRVSGRWGISEQQGSWSRDAIDEVRNKALVGATWYYVGPFKAGGCKEVLDTHDLSEPWRTTTTLFGQSFDVVGGSYLFRSGGLGTRPAMILCGGTPERPMLLYRFFFEPGNPTALPQQTLLSRIANVPVVRLIVQAHLASRWSRVKPLHADNVATADLLKYKRSFKLSQLDATVTIPDDGAYWGLENQTNSDSFSRLVPRFPQLSVHIAHARQTSNCDKAFANVREVIRKEGSKSLPTLPSPQGWRAGLTYVKTPGTPRTLLCRQRGSTVVIAEVHHAAELGDLAEIEPLLAAIGETMGSNPTTPPARPTAPVRPNKASPTPQPPRSTPRERSTYREDWGGYGSVDFAAAISYRDSEELGRDEDQFPAIRVAGPGMTMGLTTFETEGGLILRYQVGLLPDVASLFNDKAVSSSRWGGQVWEAAVDVGVGLTAGEDDFLGLTVGWHGQSGPLLLNSSVAASFHWIHMPAEPEEFGWAVRVTPLQLIPANERWLMSPLAVDLRFLTDGISFGVEFQWVGKPAAGDEDIPGEGMAAIVRLGFGSFFF